MNPLAYIRETYRQIRLIAGWTLKRNRRGSVKVCKRLVERLVYGPILGATAFCILAVGWNSDAQAVLSFQLPIKDQTVILAGIIDGRPIDLSDSVHVRLDGASGESSIVQVISNPLVPDLPNSTPIPASSITIEEKAVAAGQTADLTFVVKDVSQPGTYKGPIDLVLLSQPNTTVRIYVELRISAKPIIEILDKSLSFSISNCHSRCWFTEWIAPGSTTGDKTFVTVVNKSVTPVEVGVTADVKGTTIPMGTVLDSSQGGRINPGQSGRIPLSVVRADFAPDHYTGALVLTASTVGFHSNAKVERDGAIVLENEVINTIPISIDVRTAALGPFLIVLLGILAGRFSKLLTNGNRKARVTLYSQYTFLRDRINGLTDSAARRHCQTMLDGIWARALSGDPSDAKLRQDLSNLTVEIDLFGKLQKLHEDIDTLPLDQTDRVNIQQQLKNVSQLLLANNVTQAGVELDAARTAIENAITNANTAKPGSVSASQADVLSGIVLEVKTTAEVHDNIVKTQKSRPRNIMANALWFISGVDTTETIAFQFWFVRPLFFLGLVVILGFYGLWLQYSGTEHATFGSKGFTEYIGLFLWGFGAQVAAMNLQDIQFDRKG